MDKETIFNTIKIIILEVLPSLEPNQVVLANSLENLGANSMDRMEIIMLSLEKLDLSVPLIELAGLSFLKELVDKLYCSQ